LVILAARPGVGKTSLACQVAYHVAAHGHLCYFATLEMSSEELAIRMACTLSGVSSKRVRTNRVTPAERSKLVEAMAHLSQCKLTIHDAPGLNVMGIRRAARRLARKELSLVIVDYLQRISPSDRRIPRHEQIGQVSDGLKQLARELNVPVLCLCQLNRESEKEDMPTMRHIRESGSVEQDADVVAILHRKTRGYATGESVNETESKLLIDKNRNGETGVINLVWDGATTQFTCAPRYNNDPEFAEYGNDF
jgi:replicative DNA helicase